MEKAKTMEIPRQKKEIPLKGQYDVIVVGGGFAGVAAALASARQKKKVLLLEKRVFPGGLATAGIITHYLALCDGYGRKIIRGIAEELLHASIRYSYDTLSDEWRGGPDFLEHPTKRYETWFSFPECVVSLEELLLSEGVEILYDSLFTGVILKGDRITSILVEEKGGKCAYSANAFVDATGDAVLFHRAGAQTVMGQSLVSYGAHHMDIARCRSALQSGKIQDALEIHWYGDFPVPGRKRLFPDAQITNSREETDFILKGRGVYLERLKKEGKGNDHGTVLWPSMPLARKVRRILGEYTLTQEDKDQHVKDSIGAISDWRNPGPLYEIPYRALYGRTLANVVACGRCISSDGDAWEVTRVIPPAALTGQAAGTAASIIAGESCAAWEVSVAALQALLESAGVLIHF